MNEFLGDRDFLASAPCATLRSRGLGFVDVGVRGGVHPVVEPVGALTSVLAFEPDVPEAAQLRRRYEGARDWNRVVVESSALAEGAGPATLYLASANTNASLRPFNRAFVDRYRMAKFQPAGTIPVTATTLDQAIAAGHPGQGEFLKLDTQASEYEILRGARDTLTRSTVALLVEVWWSPPYEGQKLFSEIELDLRSLGFSFYGATVHGRSRRFMDKRRELSRERPLWGDAVFFKDPLAGGPAQVVLGERALHALFVCAALLGYFDFALELGLETWATGDERGRLERFIHRRARVSRWRSIRDSWRLAWQTLLNPGRASVAVGKFVDARRDAGNYEDA